MKKGRGVVLLCCLFAFGLSAAALRAVRRGGAFCAETCYNKGKEAAARAAAGDRRRMIRR
ncbi:hypothetical protein KNP414_00848 [Paenibacillus mucilaginosus KNP414]|uniref:Uncharacterized protein n=1 Tax=Paenibacillus mucilaginosus (strain KNP414) TaxID=1036673 RepID=F8F4P6_PAEMK|nr:hypothetical protein KNP414_00848 [Paenibacillus mucilaginosus KNP414]